MNWKKWRVRGTVMGKSNFNGGKGGVGGTLKGVGGREVKFYCSPRNTWYPDIHRVASV